MSQIITARLSRNDTQPWGFRLQGGKDFGTPLVIQKVNTGSIADKAGLQAGDAIVRINSTDLYNLRHKDAQDAIVKSGASFELVVQRGGATWKPTVTPIGSAAPSPATLGGHITPVTKTSLAATKQQVSAIGTGHNTAAKPFIPPSPVRSIVNKQYNTPVGIYSDETIAETLSAQAEVLAGGVLGVNFKKNEKVYNPEKSEVLKALHENDSEPEPAESSSAIHSPVPHPQQAPSSVTSQAHSVTKHVHAPIDRPISSAGGLPAGQNICADCERLIVGVFVRIKDKNLHVECFKCATCGTSLKNQGYYNLHNKLYCDVHARLAAMNSPPPSAKANGLVPVAVPPKNLGASTISSALSAHAGGLNGNSNNNNDTENSKSLQALKFKVNDDNNNNVTCDNRSTSSETDCSSLSSSDKENDSRPSSSLYGNINKNESPQMKSPGESFQYRTINGRVIKSVIPPGKGIKVNYKIPSNISGPKPFSYTQQSVLASPPQAGPKSPSSYPPPTQPMWAPSSLISAPKPVAPTGPVQEFIDIEKCNGNPCEGNSRVKKVEIYVASDSEEEFDPQELTNIAKPPPSNFIWPPQGQDEKVPIAAPLYYIPPETQHMTVKPCNYRPLEKPSHLSVQNIQKAESEQSNTQSETEYDCLNVPSNITATTTSTSNASSESEYKMYQTLNNHHANMFDESKEDDNEVQQINQKTFIDPRLTPPLIELPKSIKRVEFVEPEADYKAETFQGVFSNRKETWQKLTTTTIVEREQTKEEKFAATDDNPENSEIDNDENDVEEEIKGQHVGPCDGSYYQLAPSNIPQPTPKGFQSNFQKALITTCERPYHISDIAPTPEPKLPNLDLFEEALQNIEDFKDPLEGHRKKKDEPIKIPKFEVRTTKQQFSFPYDEKDIRKGSLMSSVMRTASPKPIEFMKTNVIEQVPLPDESDAYFPPNISMTPNEPYGTLESYRTKSPFVSALATGSDRPYTPFGREIMSQISLELPKDTPKVSFSNALHTAPDETFNSSSLEYEYVANPVEYTAKVYERMAVETEIGEQISSSSSAFTRVESSSMSRSFLPKIQPWSSASDQACTISYTDSASGHESMECQVSESRRCSEFQSNSRRCSEVQKQSCNCCHCSENHLKKSCDSRRCSKVQQKIDEEEIELEHEPLYPKRNQQPSPFEGMQIRVTNKMTSNLHKPDEIPTYQRKWFNLPSQNPSQTPEPEELKENVPLAFTEWSTSKNSSRRNSLNGPEQQQDQKITRHDPVRSSIAEIGVSSKPPIPFEPPGSSIVNSRRSSANDDVLKQENKDFQDEENDAIGAMISFPTVEVVQIPGGFPCKGVRKNSLADLPERQKHQFEKQRDLRHELRQQQHKMQEKQKVRQQKELEMMQTNYQTVVNRYQAMAEHEISEKIQKDNRLSAYEQEQEYKKQLELEKAQRVKEQELREQQAKELEYQHQLEEARLQENKLREKREKDLRTQELREMEYRKNREEQERALQIQQEERDKEMRRQQEIMENAIRMQQEQERREAAEAETQRKLELRRKEERDRELARIEAELREQREIELKKLEIEIREKREQKVREEKETEIRMKHEAALREQAEREQRRLEEQAVAEQKVREEKMREELSLRQKQEADRKQREEMELFNIEEEKRRQAKLLEQQEKYLHQHESAMYSSTTYQQQTVWPPTNSTTPVQQQKIHSIPIIRTDSESELNATKFHFEPLDEQQRSFMAGIRPPSTCYSPATEEKPFPSIPYYQQHLAFYEAEPEHAAIFNPKCVSPIPNRSRSPAFGPPPNPLRAFVNKPRDPELDESGIYLCGERLLSPIWYDKQNKQMPPGVQRRLHPGSSRPPSKPDLEALNQAIKKHKQESGTKPAPIPPPMPNISLTPSQPKQQVQTSKPIDTNEHKEVVHANDLPPKGIVANQIRRLSGDVSNSLFPIRSSLNENTSVRFSQQEQKVDAMPSRQDFDNRHETKRKEQQTINSYASSSNSYHQLTSNYAQNVSQSFDYHFTGQTLTSSALASFQNSHLNPNSVDNVRVSTGSVGTPGALPKHGRTFTTSGPTRGQGVLTQPSTGRIPICGSCACQVRGPFITALGRTWCPAHFLCVNPTCKRELVDIGFVEEKGDLYCEYCFEQFLAPPCSKCNGKIKGDCLNAIGKKFHPECFKCTYCGKLFGNSPFFLEEGEAYCEADWNELFTTKCFACGFPVEAGDRWVEALNNNYHSQCFNCTYCKKNLEGQSFFAKGGRPFCKNHAR